VLEPVLVPVEIVPEELDDVVLPLWLHAAAANTKLTTTSSRTWADRARKKGSMFQTYHRPATDGDGGSSATANSSRIRHLAQLWWFEAGAIGICLERRRSKQERSASVSTEGV